MREIKLPCGRITVVDDKDFEWISKLKLHSSVRKHTTYVHVSLYKNGDSHQKCYQLLHRLIIGVTNIKIHIDHKDWDGLNNTRDNLRVCSQSDNHRNRKTFRGVSKYKGVTKTPCNRWTARIKLNDKQKHLGNYKTEIEAAMAYDKAAKESGNEFFSINNV